MPDTSGWPWGENRPTRSRRLLVSIAVALFAALILAMKYLRTPQMGTDFDLVWLGARLMLKGNDPYQLIGPGSALGGPYPVLYPATALVIATPFTLLPVHAAALLFTVIGAFLLAYGATHDSWHRLPMFISAAFAESAFGAQWSFLLVAAIFIPTLAFFTSAKPQLGLAVLASHNIRISLTAAAVGGIALLAISLALLPRWPGEWLQAISTARHMRAPISQPFGFLIPAVLLRWRRPEAWVIFLSACFPITLMWYSFLVLLAVPRTYREACILSLLSSSGYCVAQAVNSTRPHDLRTAEIVWGIVVLSTFLPAVASTLRWPNTVSPNSETAGRSSVAIVHFPKLGN